MSKKIAAVAVQTAQHRDEWVRQGTEDDGPILEVRGLKKAYGQVQALRGVSLELRRREIVALLGDNGAGKSTLVKILAGAIAPDDGAIMMFGNALELRRPSDAIHCGIATVYQDLAVVNSLDVARNVYLSSIPTRWGFLVDFRRMYADAERILQSLRIQLPSSKSPVGSLSGGQRQAVAIARSLAHDAEVFVLDEPTAALGVAQSAKVNELIEDVQRQGKAVLMISHNMEHVFDIATRIVVLRHGRCVGNLARTDATREHVVGLITGAIAGDAPIDT